MFVLSKEDLDFVLESYPEIKEKIMIRAKDKRFARAQKFLKSQVTRTARDPRKRSVLSYLGKREDSLMAFPNTAGQSTDIDADTALALAAAATIAAANQHSSADGSKHTASRTPSFPSRHHSQHSRHSHHSHLGGHSHHSHHSHHSRLSHMMVSSVI